MSSSAAEFRFDRKVYVALSVALTAVAVFSSLSWFDPELLRTVMPRYGRPASIIVSLGAVFWIQMLRSVIRDPLAVRATSDGVTLAQLGFRRRDVDLPWSSIDRIEVDSNAISTYVLVTTTTGDRYKVMPGLIRDIRLGEAGKIHDALVAMQQSHPI